MAEKRKQVAFNVTLQGCNPGIYWTHSHAAAKALAWRHFRDVMRTPGYSFLDFARDSGVTRAPKFDSAYRGRQGLIPEFAAPVTNHEEVPRG